MISEIPKAASTAYIRREGPERIVRNCILCGANEGAATFTYTHDFLRNVRGHDPEFLDTVGWGPRTTSTIVRCGRCGTHYIRDVFPGFERTRMEVTPERVSAMESPGSFFAGEPMWWAIRCMARDRYAAGVRGLAMIDYGAGGGRASSVARALNVPKVVAYDPYTGYDVGDYRSYNHPGIRFTRSLDDVRAAGPYQIAVCQSVIEHVLDPRAELETLHGLLEPGGLLYINNPMPSARREMPRLQRLTKVRKGETLSHYHPGHLNMMSPAQFRRLLKGVGFRITSMHPVPPAPFLLGKPWAWLRRTGANFLRTLQNVTRYPYPRNTYIVRRES